MALLRGSGREGSALHRASLSGLGVVHSLPGEVSGSSSQFFTSGPLPEPHLSGRFPEHSQPEEVSGWGWEGPPPSVSQFSLPRTPRPTGFSVHKPSCLLRPDAQYMAMRVFKCPEHRDPFSSWASLLSRAQETLLSHKMKGPILCHLPQERQRLSSPGLGPCRGDSGWTETGQSRS